MLELTLETGRTHQIRVHASAVGHPIAGDGKYGDAQWNQALAQRGLRRLFLHATALSFTHPRSGETVSVSCPLPPDLRECLDGILSAPPVRAR